MIHVCSWNLDDSLERAFTDAIKNIRLNLSNIEPTLSGNSASMGQTVSIYSDVLVSVQKFRVLSLNTVMMLLKRMGLIFCGRARNCTRSFAISLWGGLAWAPVRHAALRCSRILYIQPFLLCLSPGFGKSVRFLGQLCVDRHSWRDKHS